MSSMVRNSIATLLALLAFSPTHACAQDDGLMGEDGRQWDQARTALQALPPGNMAQVVSRWKLLTSSPNFLFSDYAVFMLTYPGLPDEAKLRGYAELAVGREPVDPRQVMTFFDRFPPLTNPGRAHYALALYAMGRPEAAGQAREAWRGGSMTDAAEAALLARAGAALTLDDHNARADALLWANMAAQAERALVYAAPEKRAGYAARLAMVKGQDPATTGLPTSAADLSDAGYVYNRSRYLRGAGMANAAANLLTSRPRLTAPPRETRKWVSEQLAAARSADTESAVRIAALIDDTFAPGTDISRQPFVVRDDYTSLMWLGGTRALWSLGNGRRAAPLFYRYGAAARTPQTRSKGFYWAGRAAALGNDAAEAARYFGLAAEYADQFYGMLALERLNRPLPPATPSTPPVTAAAVIAAPIAAVSSAVTSARNSPAKNAPVKNDSAKNAPVVPSVVVPVPIAPLPPTPAQRAVFNARPLTKAVREVARESDWPTAVRFFREISDQAATEADHVMVADLARELGRRDLGVILGQSAQGDGLGNFQKVSFPLIPIPPGSDWTMVHAISRQESQFAMNAISHAGARGLMQLMPGTAREQAGKSGYDYDLQALTTDAGYNLRLGNGYFARMMDTYNGSYPLAVAAYNAGPGNVNKWLRQFGDPRNGSIDWIDWIEKIPLSETRNYVQRVLENAVVYEAMNPPRASYKGTNPLSHFLGKRYPG